MPKNLAYLYLLGILLVAVAGLGFLPKAQTTNTLGAGVRLSELQATTANMPDTPSPATTTPATASTTLRIPIFIYHSVKPDTASETQAQKDYSITPEMFEAQLGYLAEHGYTPISMTEFAREISAGTTSPINKPVVLGFDDGWENQYVYALPLLKKYHMTAVFYIYTHPIDVGDKRFMTWDQVKELDQAGMEIADHTLTHPYLQKLSPEQLRHEVLDSKKRLEEVLGKPVLHFASPFGYTSPELVALLKEGGFTSGRTGYKGTEHSPADMLALTGYYIHRDLKDFVWILTEEK